MESTKDLNKFKMIFESKLSEATEEWKQKLLKSYDREADYFRKKIESAIEYPPTTNPNSISFTTELIIEFNNLIHILFYKATDESTAIQMLQTFSEKTKRAMPRMVSKAMIRILANNETRTVDDMITDQ